MIIFNRVLSQTELIKRLSKEMPRSEYASLTSQIVSLAENDPKRFQGNFLNVIA